MEHKKDVGNLIFKYPKLSEEMIYKDIYLSEITNFMVNIFDSKPWKDHYFLCGGTSLSKCYKITNRLSEDIDISIFGFSISKGKKTIRDISLLIDEVEKSGKIVIIHRDSLWLEQRTFLNCKFKYKGLEFAFDVKAINNIFDHKDINKQPMWNIIDKHSKTAKASTTLIPVVDINFIVAEKLLVFHKKYIANSSDINDNYEVNRLFRHVYDIFMIFDKKLIEVNDTSFVLINKLFLEISKLEKNFDTPLNKINVFQESFFNDNKKILRTIIDNECYEKVSVQKIITFYKVIGEKINILFDKI